MNPAARYHTAATKAERHAMRVAAVEAVRTHVTRLARRLVPAKHQIEGAQVAVLGAIIALERYRPAPRRTFRAAALAGARAEIKAYLAGGVFWTPKQGRS